MSDIEWLVNPDGTKGKTWNPMVGCSRQSAGCENCYAITFAARQLQPQYVGLTKIRPAGSSRPGPDWTGEVRLVPQRLPEPLKWRKSQRVFVNSMSDLFHPQVPFEYIAAVYGIMACCPQHTFIVATKQLARAVEFFAWLDARAERERGGHYTAILMEAGKHVEPARWEKLMEDTGFERDLAECEIWPLPNVHLLASIEDQATAEKRIPDLLRCPAEMHGVSYEPALGPVDLSEIDTGTICEECDKPRMLDALNGPSYRCACGSELAAMTRTLRWVVVGGESGPKVRDFDVLWMQAQIDACAAEEVAIFCKQIGARPRCGSLKSGAFANRRGRWFDYWEDSMMVRCSITDPKGGKIREWPPELHVRQYPGWRDDVEDDPVVVAAVPSAVQVDLFQGETDA